MSRRKKLMIWVGFIAVVAVVGAIAAKYDSFIKERKAVHIAQEYLAQKYEQEMIFESVRLPYVDPVVYHVYFTSQNTGIEFDVNVSPSLLKSPEEKANSNYLSDNYLSSFFCRKTEEMVLLEMRTIWDDNTGVSVSLYPSAVYYEKNASDTNEHMTEREMEPFYDYAFKVTTNRLLSSDSKTEEARRILELFQVVRKLDYHPVEILVWYQTGKDEKQEVTADSETWAKKYIKFNAWEETYSEDQVISIINDQWTFE